MFQLTCFLFMERSEISAVDDLVAVLVLVVVVVDEAVVDEVEFIEAGLVVELVDEFVEFVGGGVQTRGVTREVTAVLFWV